MMEFKVTSHPPIKDLSLEITRITLHDSAGEIVYSEDLNSFDNSCFVASPDLIEIQIADGECITDIGFWQNDKMLATRHLITPALGPDQITIGELTGKIWPR